MKTVFSNSELAHVWASQTQNEGKTNGGFYFHGRTIYSSGSHFSIATIKDDICYFTTRSYSNTTAKHINYTRQASSHIKKLYCYSPIEADRGEHTNNLGDFNNVAKDIARSLTNARKPEIYLNQIAQQKSMFLDYCEHFNIKVTKKLETIYPYLFIESQESGKEASAKEQKAIKALKAKQEKEKVARLKREIQEFRSFERSTLFNRLGFDLLRYNSEKERIETSQAIQIPLQVAKELHNEFKNVSNGANCTLCGTKFMERYNITSISKEGIIIGCHNIKAEEINLLAASLNW